MFKFAARRQNKRIASLEKTFASDQMELDRLRMQNQHDGAFQLHLDRMQTALNEKRNRTLAAA